MATVLPKTNFGGNVPLTAKAFYVPANEQEVAQILERHRGQRIRCMGRLHSWSQVLETSDTLVDLQNLNEVTPMDGDVPSAWIGAGCQIKRALSELERIKQWTLPSVGFIAEQTIAGAISTGTHGSGKNSLSHYVQAVRVARYESTTGEVIIEEIDSPPDLEAMRCSLGSMGVILSVRMACRSCYAIEEHFQEFDNLTPVIEAENEFPLQQFFLVPWRWTFVAQHRRETDERPSRSLRIYLWYRFLVFDIAMHLAILFALKVRSKSLIRGLFRSVIPLGVVHKWRVVGSSNTQLVMKHDLFRHVEMELFVQGRHLESALRFVREVLTVAGTDDSAIEEVFREQLSKTGCEADLRALAGAYCHHYPICVRRVLVDATMISMTCEAEDEQSDDWYSISLINYHSLKESLSFERISKLIARSMADLFGARPHWGKVCPLPTSSLRELYPRFDEFKAVCQSKDPDGLFRNAWVNDLLSDVRTDEEAEPPCLGASVRDCIPTREASHKGTEAQSKC
ncbi:MAG: D-arabinono-1,4-lactone oxidase [Planctomycetota bacterium]